MIYRRYLIALAFALWAVPLWAQEAKQPVLDAGTRLQWHQQFLEMREESTFKEMAWSHIGPQLMSGRVTDIAKPLDQPHTFYVATASGGLWKTVNEGTTWKAIFDDAPSASTGAVAVDPQNSDTVWVGLGESNIFRSSMSGTGIYRSDDAGESWKHCGLASTHHIARIVVHPTDSKTVFVAACGHEYTENEERGVYRTRDGGESWQKVLYVDSMTAAMDVVVNPTDPNVIYAAMWNRIRRPWSDPIPGPGGGIFKSVDGGDNWEQVKDGLPPDETSGRIGIALSHSNPDVLYALIDSHEVARKADKGEVDAYGRPRQDVIRGAVVCRSDDAGQSWQQVSENNRRMQRLFSTYGWVFGQIRVDPNDENTVYAMGVPLMKSTDGGKRFKPLSSRGLHSDHHALWINPGNSSHLINGNDGGINISYDGGTSWKALKNLPVVQCYNVAVDQASPFNVYISIQDNGSWRGPSNHRPGRNEEINWRRVPGGEASHMQVDPNDPEVFYSESFYGAIMRSNLTTGRSKRIVPKAKEGEPQLRGQWLAPFQLSEHNSQIIYHGMQCVFRSLDQGGNWERISPDLTAFAPERQGNISYATISSLSESPIEFGLLYVGTDDGRVHMTKNGGEQWLEIGKALPQKWVSRIVASKFDQATVYLTMNGKRDDDFQAYIFRSTDFGENWQDISDNVPGGPVNVIREDPWREGVLYVGTDLGVFVSRDYGEKWNVFGSGLPITFVHDFVIQIPEKTAIIATHGRGLFKLNVKTLPGNNEEQ